MKILVVEDNTKQAQFISQSLNAAGHQTDVAHNGQAGLFCALQTDYDLIITDRMMPKLDGLKMLKALRASGNQTPALILSALDSVDERVKGLRSGGDDYLIKPFAFSELLARAEILARRTPAAHADNSHIQALDTLTLDLLSRKAKRGDTCIQLNNREFQILEYFMANPGRVITRTMLLERVWSHHFDPQTNVIDVHISRLRKKIDLEHHTPLLHTVRGAGYVLEIRL
ncbi:response regulator transcription factor [Photobacterium sp. OFAV2-7]|uniref:winged helix-turn-helix domain-containing protein n=1 Tax=Photobacterium sp. OFAV2-7 TaxID=2917748 RepID=UPI001EF5D64F|nr:response regulator transcription factor [Photobacterium sp. OFAV2-7]MCG7586886.1 response regulator transcription factor [Photobacterium sp. OFAV2-7]